jgi:WASH complex subunit 7
MQILGEILAGSRLFNDKESHKLQGYIKRIAALCSLPRQIRCITDSRFLYFNLNAVPPIIASIYRQPPEAPRLHYVISAFADGIKMCQMIGHTDVTPFYVQFRDYLRRCVKKGIIEPLCRDIEDDLRLHIHTKHLDHMQALNPKVDSLRPLKPFLDLAPVRILGTLLSVREEVRSLR